MSKFSTGQQLLGRALFWSLLAVTGCDALKGSGKTENSNGTAPPDTGTGTAPLGTGTGTTPLDTGNEAPPINIREARTATDPQSGTTATNPVSCGNGTMDLGEACDDGNETNGDGCAADCKSVETDFVCPNPGEACVRAQICGDKKISGTENCDDGNSHDGDGCSSTCRTEPGYTCSFLGARCQAAKCGDGIVVGQESCDDGQPPQSGDGCGATCLLESPPVVERNGWVCPTPGTVCQRTNCGDGTREGSEQCDDGNNDLGDGCSPFCRKEPNCPVVGGACSTACGDSILLPFDKEQGQACDDGNTVSGDGCSQDCKLEAGFYCTDEMLAQDSLTLPIVLRDFKGKDEPGGHPDFEAYFGSDIDSGIVQNTLDNDGKPRHVTQTKTTTTNSYVAGALTSQDWFAMWYRDEPTYNKTLVKTLELNQVASGFQYASTAFFPIDGLGWGNTPGRSHNYHFTSEVRYWFEYQGGETLEFLGDDDVWVFVNRQLAVDLGGLHTAITGSVILHATDGTGSVCEGNCTTQRKVELGLELGQVYEIVVFQAERHTIDSNYTLTLGHFNAKRSVCSPRCGDGVVTPDEACDLGEAKNGGGYGTCTPDCKLPPYCGDSQIDNDYEDCDEGVNVANYGFNREPACSPRCRWTHYCGDHQLDSLYGEQCDDGNEVSGDGCEANCTHRAGCGNGILEAGEQCEDGNTASGDGCSEFCTTEVILL